MALIRPTVSMTLAPGWRWIARVTARGDQLVLSRTDDAADIADADRRSVAIGDDQVGVFVGLKQLIVGVDRKGLARAVELTFW
jgi:hypothetical protein